MLTDTELVDIICGVPPGRPRQVLLAIGRAIETKVRAELRKAYDEGKTCRTCAHLDTDPRGEPCIGCREFGRWTGKSEAGHVG